MRVIILVSDVPRPVLGPVLPGWSRSPVTGGRHTRAAGCRHNRVCRTIGQLLRLHRAVAAPRQSPASKSIVCIHTHSHREIIFILHLIRLLSYGGAAVHLHLLLLGPQVSLVRWRPLARQSMGSAYPSGATLSFLEFHLGDAIGCVNHLCFGSVAHLLRGLLSLF